MKALQFLGAIPRYVFSMAAGTFTRKAYYSPLSNIVLREVDEPRLLSENWVRIRTVYSGICGSDLNLILLRDSPSSSPFVSFPLTLGHENCGYVTEVGQNATDIKVGDRVVIDPLLSCAAREISEPCRFCRSGDFSLCENFRRGIASPGFAIGYCRDTGGGWSESFVAHRSQVIKLPDEVSFEEAALIDAFCSALHPVMRNYPKDDDICLIIGAGVIGLSVVAGLRALGSLAKIVVVAKYPHQAELAASYGADEVVCLKEESDYFEALAGTLDGELLKPIIGKRIMEGGADVVFECVGSPTSIDDSLRFARAGGKVVLVGLASFPKKIDWTPIWLNEVMVKGSFWCGGETYLGKDTTTYNVAVDLLEEGKVSLKRLLTHKFRLEDYKDAIEANLDKSRTGLIKSVFSLD
jgi:threonine dehydrogenase-like Zn-dependent dehydrogenase